MNQLNPDALELVLTLPKLKSVHLCCIGNITNTKRHYYKLATAVSSVIDSASQILHFKITFSKFGTRKHLTAVRLFTDQNWICSHSFKLCIKKSLRGNSFNGEYLNHGQWNEVTVKPTELSHSHLAYLHSLAVGWHAHRE